MKALTLLIWVSWGAICARVLLAPVWHLSLQEGLFLGTLCTPAVGILVWLRWVLRPRARAPQRNDSGVWGRRVARPADGAVEEPRGVVGQLF
jgi:hypothetical protein